jgi:predicted DNA-binding antitoxin AbrB/MazE fold protein
MKHDVEAIYENGVLRPLEPLDLPEHERVRLTVQAADEDWLDQEVIDWAASEAGASVTLEEVRKLLAKVTGSLADAVIAERGEY